MKAVFEPKTGEGVWNAVPSKSLSHRALIASALALGESRIKNLSRSDDVLRTADCLRRLGAQIEETENGVAVSGFSPEEILEGTELFCGESGSTLRFLIPPVLLSGKTVTFYGTGRLFERPLSVYEALAKERGFLFEHGENSLTVRGKLEPGDFFLPGNVSSQFVTGLLFVLPLLEGESRLLLSEKPESRPYIDLTLEILRRFGISISEVSETEFRIPGGQKYRPADVTVEGDESNAAFFAALRALGSDIRIEGLSPETKQGDRVFRKALSALSEGCPVIDLGDCPDLGPVLFAVAGAKNGAVFQNVRRLRLKESDRLSVMMEELSKFGVTVSVSENGATVSPGLSAPKEPLFSHNDHRIAMALSVLLTKTGGELWGAECVSKSDPDFFEALRRLGFAVTLK